jgi:hypothetical protein
VQKNVFDNLAVGKKLKKKATVVFVVKKQKVLLTDSYFAFRLSRVNPLCGNNSREDFITVRKGFAAATVVPSDCFRP